MKRFGLVIGLYMLGSFAPSWAQLRPPNDAGVAMGEWYTIAHDVDSAKNFWILLGGTPIKVDGMDVVKFPGVLVFIRQGQASGGSEGTTINHVGLHSPNGGEVMAKMRAAGMRMAANAGIHRAGSWGEVYSPDNVRLEILDSSMSSAAIGVPGVQAASPLVGSITADHIHFFYDVPESALPAIQDWYSKTFGAKPFVDPVSASGTRTLAGSIPGIELKFSKSPDPIVPTKGRALDHIGFEIKNLQAFCKTLEESGVKFSEPYSTTRHKGYASAEFTDSWGTSIELTEGLNRF